MANCRGTELRVYYRPFIYYFCELYNLRETV